MGRRRGLRRLVSQTSPRYSDWTRSTTSLTSRREISPTSKVVNLIDESIGKIVIDDCERPEIMSLDKNRMIEAVQI